MEPDKGKGQRGDDDLREGNPLLIPLVSTGQEEESENDPSSHTQTDIDKDDDDHVKENGKEGRNKQDDNKEEKEKEDVTEAMRNGFPKSRRMNDHVKESGKEEGNKQDDDKEGKEKEDTTEAMHNGFSKSRRVGTTVAPPLSPPLLTTVPRTPTPRSRKISFADDVDQRLGHDHDDDGNIYSEMNDITQDVIPEIDDVDIVPDLPPSGGKLSNGDEEEEKKDRLPLMQKRETRYSTVSRSSRFSVTSRLSIAGLTSRASMASLKSTLTKVNSEFYPERGSFVAYSLGQSFADLPESIAQKLYIVTQVLAAVSVSMGSMAVGYNAAYTSPALASMDAENSTLTLTDEQKSWVGSLMPLSALTGSIIGGYLIDALGRKMVILICGPPFFSAMIIIGSAYNVWMLYVGRAIVGLCVGLLTLTLPVYLGETIQPEIRGTLGLLPTSIGNIGILLCFVIGWYVNWSWLAYIGSIIPLIFFSMMIFVPETPRWYVSKAQYDNAERSLQWLRGSANEVEFELEAIEKNFEMSMDESSSLKDLFKRQYLKPVLLSLGLMAFQQLSGINAVIFYTVDIFEMSGSQIDGNLCTIIVGVVNLLSIIVANVLIDKLGRKILIYISDVAMIVSLFSLGAFFYIKQLTDPTDIINEWNSVAESLSWLPLLSFMVYVVAFSLGWGPIPWLFMGEALPAKVRGPAASFVTAFNWGCTFVVTKTFPGMVTSMGAYGVFFLFGGVMVVGLLFCIFFVPETKGKTLEEIEAELSGKPSHALQRRYSEISGIVIK